MSKVGTMILSLGLNILYVIYFVMSYYAREAAIWSNNANDISASSWQVCLGRL